MITRRAAISAESADIFAIWELFDCVAISGVSARRRSPKGCSLFLNNFCQSPRPRAPRGSSLPPTHPTVRGALCCAPAARVHEARARRAPGLPRRRGPAAPRPVARVGWTQSWRTLSRPEDSALAILPPETGFCMRRLERDSCPSLLIPHSPFFPVLPTRSDSARPLSTHSASGQDSSLSFRFCLLDLILTVRFSPYQILSRGCGFCLRCRRGFSLGPPVSWQPPGLSIPDSCFCPSRGR